MRPARLHSCRRNVPCRRSRKCRRGSVCFVGFVPRPGVDFISRHVAHFARARSGQGQEFQRSCSHPVALGQSSLPSRHIAQRHGGLLSAVATLDGLGSTSDKLPFHRAGFSPPRCPATVTHENTASMRPRRRRAAQPEFAALAANGDTLHPLPRAVRLHAKEQALPVEVLAGFGHRLHKPVRKRLLRFTNSLGRHFS